MIVPRSFASPKVDFTEKSEFNNKRLLLRTPSRSASPLGRSSSPSNTSVARKELRSVPVQIPVRSRKEGERDVVSDIPDLQQSLLDIDDDKITSRLRRGSAQEILSATNIPPRRKLRGRPSQRLPRGDHVADFSRLLMDDIKSNEAMLSRSGASSFTDGLFGNIDGFVEGQMIVGSEGVDENILATRSISSESLASLASPDDYGSSGLASPRSSLGRSCEIKRLRHKPNSEECITNHPLLEDEHEETSSCTSACASPSNPPVVAATTTRKSKSFKSSLTASLKALKSAAQSVSSRANFLTSDSSDEHLARSFFDIQPFLTDDKRPPPANKPPSAQLRRYLNPYSANIAPDSPAQLHFWHDDRSSNVKTSKKSKSKSRRRSIRNGVISPLSVGDLPPVVQLATCLPPSVRTANASSPPIWLNADGTPSNKQTATPLQHDPDTILDNPSSQPRHREPRENRDFLRIFVCEMAMRRKGKLTDDADLSRARLWLPPLDDKFRGTSTQEGDQVNSGKVGAERWKSWTHDDL